MCACVSYLIAYVKHCFIVAILRCTVSTSVTIIQCKHCDVEGYVMIHSTIYDIYLKQPTYIVKNDVFNSQCCVSCVNPL